MLLALLGCSSGASVFSPELTSELPVLTASRSTGRPREVAANGDAATRLDSVRVLVVDDDEDSRELVRGVLEMQGAAVETAASASEVG